ncbi:MAG: hypothetical protein Q4G59_02430 [Planctomycetia bacterium]|nr:hypothetical protein [Planctomycetia bacterium]
MPNIALQPDQIRSIYWIVILILALLALLFTVKVILDETKEEPNDFVKRYTLFIFLSWCLVGLWFAPSWFPQYFRAISGENRPRSVQRGKTSQSKPPTPGTQNAKAGPDSEDTDIVPTRGKKQAEAEDATSDETPSGDAPRDYGAMSNVKNSDAPNPNSETEDESDDDESSETPVKKDIDPKVMKRIRADKS